MPCWPIWRRQAVGNFGWLTAGEMADGLGLAETTPGPLIMVTQFVGFLAAFRAPEPFSPLVAGLLGRRADHLGHLSRRASCGSSPSRRGSSGWSTRQS